MHVVVVREHTRRDLLVLADCETSRTIDARRFRTDDAFCWLRSLMSWA
jgi:hypothetical protein